MDSEEARIHFYGRNAALLTSYLFQHPLAAHAILACQFLDFVLNSGLPTGDYMRRMAWGAIGESLEEKVQHLGMLLMES